MDVQLVDVPAELRLIPIQRVSAAFSCSERTLLKRLQALGIPVTRLSHNTRGLSVADMARLLAKIQNHRPAGDTEHASG